MRLLCSAGVSSAARAAVLETVASAQFEDPECAIVYEELQKMIRVKADISSSELRETLPAQLTRRGFPELDVGDLFAPERLAREAADAALRAATEQMKARANSE